MLERMTSMKLEDLKLGMRVKMTDLGGIYGVPVFLTGFKPAPGMEVRE